MQEGVGKNQILKVPLTDTMSAYSRQFPIGSADLSEWMNEIHTRGIQEVVFWGTKSEASGWKNDPVFRDLVKKLQEDKIRLSTMDGAKFRSAPDTVRKLDRFLRSHLGSVLICYSENEASAFVKLMQEVLEGEKEPNKTYTPYTPEIPKEKPKKEKQESIKNHSEEFKASRITIRVKLLAIVSAIVVVSMGLVIGLATNLFRNYTVSLIQEYNLSLARLTGLQVGLRIKELSSKSSEFEDKWTIQPAKGSDSKKIAAPPFISGFFLSHPKILGWGKYENGESVVTYNPRFIRDLRRDEEEVRSLWAAISKEDKEKMFSYEFESTHLENVSSKFGFPAVLFIQNDKSRKGVGFFLISPQDLWEAARSALQTELFAIWVVDSRGRLIAHTEESETVSAKDYSKNPLVQFLLRSPADNGSQTAEFEGKETLGSFQQLEDVNLAVVSSIEADKAFEAVYKIRRQNFYILISVLSLAFLVVFLFSRTLTVPLINLLSATRQIERGNYKVSIKPVTRDEVGVLTNSFLKMAHGLEEREKIKDTFGKFVNKEIAERALAGDMPLGGVTKDVTVFFSDLRNFTGMSEKLKPSEVVDFLNAYFTEMVECIYLTEGIVDKFIGDAIMAHWGALYTDENDARNAINSALLMRSALLEFNRIGVEIGRPQARFGCGINTGPVVVGQIGSEKKLEFTVIGDAVNLASRIEYLTKDFGTDILVSETSYEKVKDHYKFETLPPVWIRGKEKPQQLYAVLGWLEDPDCPKNLQEVRKLCGISEPESSSKAIAD
ncbi:adenylate/guanylate cyclase domain-containing protein [Leptospira sarikeiensis]|uniref:HAMP domain-containing protein n=1 Tax=Leptospira sarikeiensis TaxID=2484943 RepID=A0A4R9KCG4_9LEPT|nr:adenylate/guanylate cyclase domain-containing protein [Leptospira sarikeiensis]TGL63731.1 HAMP domain-containing protein [Leptospira sarikeiensis]